VPTLIVLASHGAPPRDAPKLTVALTVALHMALEHSAGPLRSLLARWHARLDARLRSWPRTAENDPFHASSLRLAVALSHAAGCEVLVGYNEFCAPSLDAALDAAARGAERVLVVTPMLTAGGEHAEEDIPAAIARARTRHPGCEIVYAWPFELDAVARLLAAQAARFG
jgi:sirohydrochlorin cobaltochelatase